MLRILITGGAGFIGSHLARRLIKEHFQVTLLDNFNPQIHGTTKRLSPDLEGRVKLVIGDVRDRTDFFKALENQDVVVHLAAETGTGQSMYEVHRYADVNVCGTAVLIDYLVNHPLHSVKKIIVASSRAIYGEGKYRCLQHGIIYPGRRQSKDLKNKIYDPLCPICNNPCVAEPTDELTPMSPTSFYGLTKQTQEQIILMFARTLGISGYALRYQNVYGPGQSLKNPYTGILAIFSNQARQGKTIKVFEDGLESRDFVFIDDIVQATMLCIQNSSNNVESLNVGSGIRTKVIDIVKNINKYFGNKSEVVITDAFREGDIRHCYADLTKINKLLGFAPKWNFETGILEFLSWAEKQTIEENLYLSSLKEMKDKGLYHE